MLDFIVNFWPKFSAGIVWLFTSITTFFSTALDGFKLMWAFVVARWVALATYIVTIIGLIGTLWEQAASALGQISTDLSSFAMTNPSAVSALGIVNYLLPVEELLWGITFLAGLYLAVLSVRSQFAVIKWLIGLLK